MSANLEKIIVPARPGLDPVFVYFENIEPGAGRVVLICYDMAWTAYWGAMGDRTIQQFFAQVGIDYLMGNISQGRHYKRGSGDMAYLKRIVTAVHQHVNSQQVAA